MQQKFRFQHFGFNKVASSFVRDGVREEMIGSHSTEHLSAPSLPSLESLWISFLTSASSSDSISCPFPPSVHGQGLKGVLQVQSRFHFCAVKSATPDKYLVSLMESEEAVVAIIF